MKNKDSSGDFLKEIVVPVIVAACFSVLFGINVEYNSQYWLSNIYKLPSADFSMLLAGIVQPPLDILGFAFLFKRSYIRWRSGALKLSFLSGLIFFIALAAWPKITFHIIWIIIELCQKVEWSFVQYYRVAWIVGWISVYLFIEFRSRCVSKK